VRLSKAQIGSSRAATSDRPVSKQKSPGLWSSLRGFRHWSAADRVSPTAGTFDRHLRSCHAVIGHRLHANDGKIGHVEDFLIDDKGWVVEQLVVTPSSRSLPEKARVVVASDHVSAVSWPNATVFVDLPRAGLIGPRNPSLLISTRDANDQERCGG
jgi:hypothetical protein